MTDQPKPDDDDQPPGNDGHFDRPRRRHVVQGGMSHFGTGFWPPPDAKPEPPRPPSDD